MRQDEHQPARQRCGTCARTPRVSLGGPARLEHLVSILAGVLLGTGVLACQTADTERPVIDARDTISVDRAPPDAGPREAPRPDQASDDMSGRERGPRDVRPDRGSGDGRRHDASDASLRDARPGDALRDGDSGQCPPDACFEPHQVCVPYGDRAGRYRCLCEAGTMDNGFGTCVAVDPLPYPGPCASDATCAAQNRVCLARNRLPACGGCRPGYVEGGSACRPAQSGCKHVALVGDPLTLEGALDEIDRLVADLDREGYCASAYPVWQSDPTVVRGILKNIRAAYPQMAGAILVGAIPYPYQTYWKRFANPAFPDEQQTSVSLQYYQDLDGVFSVSPSPPSDHVLVLDSHGGAVGSEIWVSLLPFYRSSDETIAGVRRYLDRNHTYRCGGRQYGGGMLVVTEHQSASTTEEYDSVMQALRDGQYAWIPLSQRPDSEFYLDTHGLPGVPGLDQGYNQRLASTAFNLAELAAHGTVYAHGILDLAWAQSHLVGVPFLLTMSCSTGNLSYSNNFVSTVFYRHGNEVVLALGQTSESGGLGTNVDGFYGANLAADLAAGKSFGSAYLEHINADFGSGINGQNREWQVSTPAFWGDLTLRLQQFMTAACDY